MLNLLRMDLHRMGRSASTWVILACTVLVALFCVAMTDGDIQDMARRRWRRWRRTPATE